LNYFDKNKWIRNKLGRILLKWIFLQKTNFEIRTIDLLKIYASWFFLIENFEIVSPIWRKPTPLFWRKSKASKRVWCFRISIQRFLDEITIKIFLLRGKFVYLHIKRRRGPIKPLRNPFKEIGS
jgi:hypothetical protein